MKKSSTFTLFAFLLTISACDTNNQQANNITDSASGSIQAGDTTAASAQQPKINVMAPTLYLSSHAFKELVPQTAERNLQKIMLSSTLRGNVLLLMGWPVHGSSETDYDTTTAVILPEAAGPGVDITGRDVIFSIQKIGHAKVVKIKKYFKRNPTVKGIYLDPQISEKGFLIYELRGIKMEKDGLAITATTNPSPPATAKRKSNDP